MKKPKALDLFCGAGGAAMGLHRAGFDVIGVDIKPQPRYPFHFICGDALLPPLNLSGFALIWASPPCQNASVGSRRWQFSGKEYPDLIPATRALLLKSGIASIIENVVGAAMRSDVVLTGTMFGLKTWRRRHFEIEGFFVMHPVLPCPAGPKRTPGFVTVAGNGGDGPNRLSAFREALDIDWMTKAELREAIPPAYSEFIGRAAIAQLNL